MRTSINNKLKSSIEELKNADNKFNDIDKHPIFEIEIVTDN